MEEAAHVDPHIAEDIAARRWRAEREAEDEGRRRGEGGVARGAGRLLVEIDGIRLAGRMREEFELALFDVDLARIGGEALEALVDHRPLLCLAERSEEHTSELQSLMRISYDVFCLKNKK